MLVIRTIGAPLRVEPPKIKGSRFIASVAPIASAEDASRFLAERRQEYKDATHNCYAWRLAEGEAFRYNDDGEPSGTAGRPILQEIDGRDLVRVAVVVTRYYGGTKLGSGGLVRAYGGAAAAALDHADIVERPVVDHLRLRFDYALDGPVRGVLSRFRVEPSDARYGGAIDLALAIPVAQTDALRDALIEAAAGRIEIDLVGDRPIGGSRTHR